MLIILSPGFPKDETDTTCLPAIQKMVLSLRDTIGAEKIMIISLQYPFDAAEYIWHKIKVIGIGGNNKKGIFRLITWYKAWQKLRQINKTQTIKGILAFWLTETALLAQWYGRLHRIKRIFWIQGQDVKKENHYISYIKPHAEQVAAISYFSRLQFEKNHRIKPAFLFRNGIYELDFPNLNEGRREIAVMGAGSLTPVKNYALFIDVLQIVHQRYPNLKFLHVGEGPLALQLKQAAKEKGLKNSLIFLGKTPHEKVYQFMNQSEVFLHTSLFEGSSTVIAEALYLGCKIVSTIGLEDDCSANIALGKSAEELAEAVLTALESKTVVKRIISHNLSQTSLEIAKVFGLQTL